MANRIEITINIKNPAERVRAGLFHIESLNYFLTVREGNQADSEEHALHLENVGEIISAMVSACVGATEEMESENNK